MFLDTSGLLCYHSKDEPEHKEAQRLFKGQRRHVTHSYVLAEFVALAQVRKVPREPTLRFSSRILVHPRVEVVWVDRALHEEALDLSQEVFLRVFRTIHAFRGQSALRTWIYRIVINQARNRQRWWRRRHRAQQVSLDQHIQNHGDLPEPDGVGPDRLLGQKQLAERIRVALDKLPFDQKTALVLREIDGLSYDEIGFSLGIAVGTVKSRLARAREALRAELRDV